MGWEPAGLEGERRKSSGPFPEQGTCKSGERRAGALPNDSSTALYKYRRAGSTTTRLLVEPRDAGASPPSEEGL